MLNKVFNKILIIDGSYILHRALHVPSLFELKAPSGEKSGGIYQVLKSINYELKRSDDYFPVICWDAGLSKRRVNADINYKRAIDRINNDVVLTKETINDDYVTQYRKQRSVLIDTLSFAGIPSLRFNGWEGDDLIYILSKLSNQSLVLTDDKDMLQLINENCKVFRPMKDIRYDVDKLLEEYNINNVFEFVLNKAIVGDESDNIPGCCVGVSDGTSNNIVKIFNACKEEGISFSEIIHNPYDLKIFCKNHNIKFFKSYVNFDLQRFKTNLELIDLNRVQKDITEDIVTSIISIVSNCQNTINYFAFIQRLNEYAIHDVSADELTMNVKSRLKNIEVVS